jgi:dihydrolipoamide dehydrogenase
MLAHFAAHQGITAAYNIAYPDKPKKIGYNNIPNCIFTDPEIASVGLKDEFAQIDKFEFLGSGMARILDETEGFIKISSEKNTGRIISAVIIGARATELIGILTLAIQNRLTISSIKNTIFAHPTLSESIGEAFG